MTSNLEKIVSSISPRVVSQSLSLPLLHSHPFSPSSTDSTLDSGLLQLAPGTVLLVGEDEMGQGGQLQEKAVKNIRALMECAKDQTVRYEYPYMDGLKMECSIRVIVLSEGKSLVPVSSSLMKSWRLLTSRSTLIYRSLPMGPLPRSLQTCPHSANILLLVPRPNTHVISTSPRKSHSLFRTISYHAVKRPVLLKRVSSEECV